MTPLQSPTETGPVTDTAAHQPAALSSTNERTLAALFRHPTAHNLEWTDILALIGTVGGVEHQHNSEVTFTIDNQRYLTRKPHGKDIVASDVIALRKFVKNTYGSPDERVLQAKTPHHDVTDAVVAIDHHGATFYPLDVNSTISTPVTVKPHDPYHFLHHLTHKDQSRQQGQRAPEDVSFYQRIADDLSPTKRVILIGHGKGKSNAAHRLVDYLDTHAPDTFRKIVHVLDADLSHTSPHQLIEMARASLATAVAPATH